MRAADEHNSDNGTAPNAAARFTGCVSPYEYELCGHLIKMCALGTALTLLCCGIGLLAQPLALLFGVLALKNEEPEKTKAWIGAIIGAIGTVIAVFFVYALIVEAGN